MVRGSMSWWLATPEWQVKRPIMHSGGSLLWQEAGRTAPWCAGPSPLRLILAPLLATRYRECAARPDTATWKGHQRTTSWALSKELGPWVSTLRPRPLKQCPCPFLEYSSYLKNSLLFPLVPWASPQPGDLRGAFVLLNHDIILS